MVLCRNTIIVKTNIKKNLDKMIQST